MFAELISEELFSMSTETLTRGEVGKEKGREGREVVEGQEQGRRRMRAKEKEKEKKKEEKK